jgi:uncharacterized membrane protein
VLTLTLIAAFLNLVLLAAVFGVYFTYSNSVVPGLDRAEPDQAVAAMRQMNIAIINPRFLATFIGPVITATATGVLLLSIGEDVAGYLFLAGAVVYLVGCVIITQRINIPLNNALENSESTDWTQRWADFSPRWRRWNTVRTFSSGLSLLLCGAGLYICGN